MKLSAPRGRHVDTMGMADSLSMCAAVLLLEATQGRTHFVVFFSDPPSLEKKVVRGAVPSPCLKIILRQDLAGEIL